MAMTSSSLKDFLQPLAIDLPKIHSLASRFCKTFKILAARSQNQFLPTPISELLLSPSGDEQGRYDNTSSCRSCDSSTVTPPL